MEKLYIIKIGGNIIDDDVKLHAFLSEFAGINGKKILVHGGGKLATRLAETLNIPQQMVEGRRITDAETLKVVTMVYAGYINKNIVAILQSKGSNAIGICGADGNAVKAGKRIVTGIDYGFAGDVEAVNTALFLNLLGNGHSIVVAPITHDGKGQLLNTNADTMAQEIAKAMSLHYQTQLVYSFEKAGVLREVSDNSSLIPAINRSAYEKLKAGGIIHSGMVPKLDNAFAAIKAGVYSVTIGQAEALTELINGKTGTRITNE